MALMSKVVNDSDDLVVGSIIRNWRGEYGMVMPNKQILRISEQEAQKFIAEAERIKT